MDFESPDVEREFPGLYMSESGSGKRSQESDFSDDAHERSTKKDLLIGKRKDKKESKKDLGYAALEGESSPEEDLDIKSPCKSKKSKSFKFPTIKDKREKSREKDVKEKEKDKDKEKEKEREPDREKSEKKKEFKSKLKLKDKKKIKPGDDTSDSVDEMPVFGVPLSVAVDRSHCHDGVAIPIVVRDCIDHVQEFGLLTENIYKVLGVKSKVQQLRRSYNKREAVKLSDYDLQTVTSLLKTFLRELPDPLLTNELASKFEDVACLKELAAREQELGSLLPQIPPCNMLCLSWLMQHFQNVAANESHNKMSISALGAVLGPVLQTSPKVFAALLTHSGALFPHIQLVKYIPPLSAGCTSLPNSKEAIVAELAKQDSLLNQIHSEMNHGYTVRSDQLWEVQRFITLLKRKLRTLEKAQEASHRGTDKVQAQVEPPAAVTQASSSSVKAMPVSPSGEKIDFQMQTATEETLKGVTTSEAEDRIVKDSSSEVLRDEVDSNALNETSTHETTPVSASAPVTIPVLPVPTPTTNNSVLPLDQSDASNSESDEKLNESQLELEHNELLKLQNYLLSRISHVHEEIQLLRAELKSTLNIVPESALLSISTPSSDSKLSPDMKDNPTDESTNQSGTWTKERKDLYEQNTQLMEERLKLVRQIIYEQEACLNLRVQLEQLKQVVESK